MARCRQRGAYLGVFLCDLDGFKKINDEYGHLEGNRALKAIAASLKECCRSYDYVARMGGDEFVLVLPGLEESKAEENAGRFRMAVEMAGIQNGFAGLSLSIGAVVFSESSSDADADAILAEADRRMYANKRRRKALGNVAESADARRYSGVPAKLIQGAGESLPAPEQLKVWAH
jgi:diguanylate cyclase (GGDEF)-like protein